MGQVELHEKFISALENRIAKRSALVSQISEILKIERDSANRRLTGKVQFSIREMGILSQKLGVSIDALIYGDITSCPELLTMENPGLCISSDEKITQDMEYYANTWKRISQQPYSEYGAVMSSLPLELYVQYPNLMKLSCFKWRHYIHNNKSNFKEFEVNNTITKLIKNAQNNFQYMQYSFYIWDYSVIWGIICDLNYFRNIELIDQGDIQIIKDELKDMLNSFEKSLISGEKISFTKTKNVEHYVSSVDMEISASYLWSENDYHSFIYTFFMRSATFSDKAKCIKIREWINSMKRVSTLISGSGEFARVKFFKKQHQYIEHI